MMNNSSEKKKKLLKTWMIYYLLPKRKKKYMIKWIIRFDEGDDNVWIYLLNYILTSRADIKGQFITS